MVQVIAGKARRASPTSVVARVVTSSDRPSDGAVVRVVVADRDLSRAIVRGVVAGLERAMLPDAAPAPIVRFRTQRRLAALGEARVRGAIAVVRVTSANARRLPRYIGCARDWGVLGVQLVWDGRDPPPERAERHVFFVLEEARSLPTSAPVILSRSEHPLEILELTARARAARQQEKR